MESLVQFVAPPGPCGYLPDQVWRLEYELVGELSAAEYLERMANGWRRFGNMLFRPRCPACTACQTLRVLVDHFRPSRSQRRARAASAELRLEIGTPSVTRAKLDLYDRFHAFQTDFKGWPCHEPKDADEFARSFVDNPFPALEWCYYLGDRLAGVGYVDDLPGALSAIYFFYDPDLRHLSPGIGNVLRILDNARSRRIPYVYLGYYVQGCRSMEYKATFTPNQVLTSDGAWRDFRP